MEEELRTTLARQASEWFVAHREGSMTECERTAFVEWLRASPMHVQEYLAVAGLARDMQVAAEGTEFSVERLLAEAAVAGGENVLPLRDADVTRAAEAVIPQGRRHAAWAIAAGIAALAAVTSPWLAVQVERLSGVQMLATAHGEQRIWRLDDGSVVHVNSDSKVKVRLSNASRDVEVERGQALFDVTHEPGRRFRVVAGDVEVVAVGTSFDVYRKREATVVTVVEGKVEVYDAASRASAAMPAGQSPAIPRPVSAGEQLRISRKRQPPAADHVDVRKAVAWAQQQIIFDEERLADVASEFNRYGRVPIEIEDAALQELRVSGVFNAYDTESFLSFVSKLEGVRVRPEGDRIRVTGREAA